MRSWSNFSSVGVVNTISLECADLTLRAEKVMTISVMKKSDLSSIKPLFKNNPQPTTITNMSENPPLAEDRTELSQDDV